MRRLSLLLVGLLLVMGQASADSWRAPQVAAKASAGGEYVVRIVPGTSMGDVYGFGGMPKGPYATAEWYRFRGTTYERVLTAPMPNPIAPVEIEVTRQGALVAIDNWHNLGVGSVVVFFSPEGRRVRSLTLLDLYSTENIAKLERSISSIHWRCESGPSISLETDRVLLVDDSLGGRFVFKVDTGDFDYQPKGGGCKR